MTNENLEFDDEPNVWVKSEEKLPNKNELVLACWKKKGYYPAYQLARIQKDLRIKVGGR